MEKTEQKTELLDRIEMIDHAIETIEIAHGEIIRATRNTNADVKISKDVKDSLDAAIYAAQIIKRDLDDRRIVTFNHVQMELREDFSVVYTGEIDNTRTLHGCFDDAIESIIDFIVFLDIDVHIEKSTPAATAAINLVQSWTK